MEKRQDDDGQVYLGYFVSPYAFVWDGKTDHIEVSEGGMGEPVVHRIHFDARTMIGLASAMARFQSECERWMQRPEHRLHGRRPR